MFSVPRWEAAMLAEMEPVVLIKKDRTNMIVFFV
jgi:hypothetical protein